MFSGLTQHANHRDPPLALHDAPGPKAPDARRSLLACSAASSREVASRHRGTIIKGPFGANRSTRHTNRLPPKYPAEAVPEAPPAPGRSSLARAATSADAQAAARTIAPAPAAQELQVRTGQRHPDPVGQPTRPVTRTGQAPIPGMHYRLPRHERLNLSRKAEMTRKITGITCRIGRRSAACRPCAWAHRSPLGAARAGHAGDQVSVSIRRACASSLDKKLITAREHSRSPPTGAVGPASQGPRSLCPLRRRATCHRGLLTGAPNWPDRRIPSAAVDLIRPAVLVQVLLAHGLRLGPRGVPDRAADVPRVSVGGGPGHAPRATL